MPPLSVMLKPSSGMCNMQCAYCFYCDETEKRSRQNYGFMTEDTLKNIIRRTLPRAEIMASYAFQGGEPTLRGLDFFRAAVRYQRQYNRNEVRIQNALQTNGLLLDEAWCQFLAENDFLVGISIDGTQAVHDRYRRVLGADCSAFERAARAAEMMDRFGVQYNVLTVVTADAAAAVDDIYRAYALRGWHWQQYIPCLDPLMEDRGRRPYSLTPEVYGAFLVELFDLWHRDAVNGRQPYIRQFENYAAILMGAVPEACDQRGTCGVQYVCEADGSVYPCDFYMLDAFRLGNFNQDRLDAVDRKRREIGFLEESAKLDPACAACEYAFICRGGCQRHRDVLPGGLYRNYFCPAYKQFFSQCLPRLQALVRRHLSK